MTSPSEIPEALKAKAREEAGTVLNSVLKPLGTNLRHYMDIHRDAAIEAMCAALLQVRNEAIAEERSACAALADAAADDTPLNDFDGGWMLSAEHIAAAIRARP